MNKNTRKKYMVKKAINLFIFRRDLRIEDNVALNMLSQDDSTEILGVFIFNPKQIDKSSNPYFSTHCVEFMIQSLKQLNHAMNDRLIYLYGKDTDVLNRLLNKYQIQAVGYNHDYTPFSIERDSIIEKWCESKKIKCVTGQDYTILPLGTVLNGSKNMYSVFTPFYNQFLTKYNIIPEMHTNSNIHFAKERVEGYVKNIDKFYDNSSNTKLELLGGRNEALKRLIAVKKGGFKNYDTYRDYPSMNKTTMLSPYIKFGCISIREAFFAFKKGYGLKHGLVRELIWREFYANIAFAYPRILAGQLGTQNLPFKEKYDAFPWKKNEEYWKSFTSGKTGFPIIDASIRHLVTTGWCPNRCRMIIANFGIKDLLIDWRILEKWYASHAIDYDPCSNNGGWQSVLTGEGQPYFRTFNPWLQAEKFDSKCEYIKKWIPELSKIDIKDILKWDVSYVKYPQINYLKPIVDHTIESKIVIEKLKIWEKQK